MINERLDACQFYCHLTKFALLMQTFSDKNLATAHMFLKETKRRNYPEIIYSKREQLKLYIYNV